MVRNFIAEKCAVLRSTLDILLTSMRHDHLYIPDFHLLGVEMPKSQPDEHANIRNSVWRVVEGENVSVRSQDHHKQLRLYQSQFLDSIDQFVNGCRLKHTIVTSSFAQQTLLCVFLWDENQNNEIFKNLKEKTAKMVCDILYLDRSSVIIKESNLKGLQTINSKGNLVS